MALDDTGQLDGSYTPPDPPPYLTSAPSPTATPGRVGITDPPFPSPEPAPAAPRVARGDPNGGGTGPNGGSTAPQQPTGPSGDPQAWLMAQLSAGGDPQSIINQMNAAGGPYAALAAAYYPTKGAGVVGLSGGSYLAKNADGSWGWNVGDSQGGGGGGSSAGTGPAPGQGSGTGFADPAYQALNALAQARIASLQQPQSFPQLDALMQQLQSQQAVNKQRAQDLATQWGSRVTELQQPLLTTPQVVQQRALAENPLLASRDAALANAKARQSARGFAPTSGLAADEARQINENESNQQAQIDARLEQGNIATDESRRNEATQLQGLITQALNGGDATALQEQAQVADLENQQYQTDQQRQTQQLATAQIPVDLTNQGFSNASSAVASPTSAFGSLMPLLQLALTGQNNSFNQSTSQSSGLSQIITNLLSQFS